MTQQARPRPISTLLFMALSGFVLLIALILTAFALHVDWRAGQLQSRTEAALFDSIRAELQASYQAIEQLLHARHQDYRRMHEQALALAQADDHPPDLEHIQQRIESEIGIPVDVYLINPELRIIDTTYAPDQNLDFSHPALFDGRYMIERAHEEDDIVISAPVLEAVERAFRVYTYSPLGEEGYTLELGFRSPIINRFFRDIEQQIAARDAFDAKLHFLMWDDWLLSLHPDRSDVEDKRALLDEHHARQREAIARFREARDQNEAVRVTGESRQATYYLHILDIPTDEEWDMSLMAEVRMTSDAVTQTRTGMILAVGLTIFLIIASTVLLFLLARKALVTPISEAATAIEAWEPVTLRGPGRRIRELQLLASHFNSMLSTARSRIQGLDREARTDALTGLGNRAAIESELEIELLRHERYQHPCSLMLLDLDHFKRINDRHGHLVGDQVLQIVARTLLDRSREVDSLGRWGGEEFLILCRDTRLQDAITLAEDLREAVESETRKAGYPCTASFGVVSLRAGDSLHSLFERADKALYTAKRNGRNRVVSLS